MAYLGAPGPGEAGRHGVHLPLAGLRPGRGGGTEVPPGGLRAVGRLGVWGRGRGGVGRGGGARGGCRFQGRSAGVASTCGVVVFVRSCAFSPGNLGERQQTQSPLPTANDAGDWTFAQSHFVLPLSWECLKCKTWGDWEAERGVSSRTYSRLLPSLLVGNFF